MPVQVSTKRCVLCLPKAIQVRGGKAGGDADEHVIEREAQHLGVPTATPKATFGKEHGPSMGLRQLPFHGQHSHDGARALPLNHNPKRVLLNDDFIELILRSARWSRRQIQRDGDFISAVVGIINLGQRKRMLGKDANGRIMLNVP